MQTRLMAPMSKAIAGEPRLRTGAFWMCDGVNAGLVGSHGTAVTIGLPTYQARRPEELQT